MIIGVIIRAIRLLSCLFLVLLGAAELVAKENPQATPLDKPAAEVGGITFEPAMYVAPGAMVRDLKKDPGKIILVDVRRGGAFEKARIPGSINVPLFSIKTKNFLRGKPLLLVNEGYCTLQMQRTCAQLNRAGFDVRILFGGLKMWWEKGGAVMGDFFYLNSLRSITPSHFHSIRKSVHWVVINRSGEPMDTLKELFPGASVFSFKGGGASLKKTLNSQPIFREKDQFFCLLLINRDGTGYENIKVPDKAASVLNLFCLEGGIIGYQSFISKLSTMHNQKKRSKVKTEKCGQCP